METIQEINNKIDEKFNFFNNAWEHFKDVNNERLKEIESKGYSDPLLNIKLEKLNSVLEEVEEQKSKLNKLEIAISRPHSEILQDNKSINEEELQYKAAFNNYLKKGIDDQLYTLEQKRDLTTSTVSDSSYGGFLLSPNLQKMILDNLQEKCVMRKICSVQEISSSSFDVLQGSSMTPSWLSETGTVSDTDTSVFSKKTITTHDLVAQPKVSQRMLDDSAINLEEWLANRIADDFAIAEENAFINGSGANNNQPTGILSYSTEDDIETTVSSASSGFFTANEIMDLYYSLGKNILMVLAF